MTLRWGGSPSIHPSIHRKEGRNEPALPSREESAGGSGHDRTSSAYGSRIKWNPNPSHNTQTICIVMKYTMARVRSSFAPGGTACAPSWSSISSCGTSTAIFAGLAASREKRTAASSPFDTIARSRHSNTGDDPAQRMYACML